MGTQLGMVAVLAGVVGFSFGRVFGGAELGLLVVGPAVGAVVVSGWVTGVRGFSPSGALLASLGVGVVVVTVVTWRVVPSPAALGRTLEAVVAARGRILSAPLPAPDRPELLVVVAACTWLAAHAAAELVVRVRSVLLPLLPFVVGMVVPLVLGADGRPASGLVLGALTVGAVTLVLARSAGPPADAASRAGAPDPSAPQARAPDPNVFPVVGAERGASRAVVRLRRRRVLAAVPVVVVAGVVPLALRDHLPMSRSVPRFDPRAETRGAPPDLRNPLVEVSVQRSASENEELFVAQASGEVEYWRLAVLDTFDGATWRSSATFAPAGRELPRTLPGDTGSTDEADSGGGEGAGGSEGGPPLSGRRVRQEITVGGLDSPLLPVAGHAVELDGPRVRFDPAGGMVLAERSVGEGATYQVESVVPAPAEGQLDVAQRDRTGSDTAAARQPVPEAGLLADVAITEVTNRSAALTGSADVRQLRALQDFFADQDRFRIATEPMSGLSLRHLTELVRVGLEGGPSEGSVEQFAAAYAVMARTLGFATRVVAGYRTVGPDGDGRYHVDNHDAFAWAEVKLEGLGWVPFVAVPIRSQSSPPTQVPTSTTSTTLTDAGTPTPTTEAPGGDAAPRRSSGSAGVPWWLVAAAVVAGLAAAALAAGPVLRRLRRWRRARHPDMAHRIDGAWRELLDRLAAHQVPVTLSMTATEVVQVTSAHLGTRLPDDAAELAALANRARFGPTAPASAAASAAWHHADQLTRWVRRRLPRTRRLRAWLDPRPLRP